MPFVAPDIVFFTPDKDVFVFSREVRLCFDCVLDCSRYFDVVSNNFCADSTIPENVCRVFADADKSEVIRFRFVIKFEVIVSVPVLSAALETVCNAVRATLDIVFIKTSFTCVCIAVAPLSVTFGAIAFSFALE